MGPVHELGFCKKGNQEQKQPTTETGAQCGAYSMRTPHASRITANYMVGCCEHPVTLLTHSTHPCYHSAVSNMTAQSKADQTVAHFP